MKEAARYHSRNLVKMEINSSNPGIRLSLFKSSYKVKFLIEEYIT